MKKGIWYAVGAYVFWGFFPVYWKVLRDVPAVQLLGHRIIWSFLLLCAMLLILRQGRDFTRRLSGRVILTYAIAAVLIGINWLTYVWAIGHERILETSLGYYINPLLSVLLGVIILRERLRPVQWIPIGLAAAGVLYLTFAYGSLPWIALSLAFTFGLYGLVKKTAPLGSFHGLTLETAILFLPALGYLLACEFTGQGAFLHSDTCTNLMLLGAGAVTVIPLLLFAAGARRIPLTTMGFLQYMNPTLQFLLGWLVYHEDFDPRRLVGFALVWVALILYSLESYIAYRRGKKKQAGLTGVDNPA